MGRSVTGIILILLGVLFLFARWTGIGGEGIVAVIGVAFLAAYAVTGQYGLLVPGGIMTGLGIGIIYETRLDAQGAPVLLGLGLGFISIYIIGRLRGRLTGDWWPLIPGGVLAAIGLVLAGGQTGVMGAIGRWWPAALILLGLYLIYRQRRRPTA